MKNIFTIVLSITLINAFSQYCTTGGPTSISDSDLGVITLNGETQNINILATCPAILGVEDLTGSQSADLKADSSYSISIDFNTCGGNYANASEVWIDFNLDDDFDANESIGVWTGTTPSGFQNYNFTVPTWVCNGITRIRVVQQEGGALPLDPCASFTWGAVIDAEISLSGGTCQSSGCTDNTALNYNSLATVEDGSCLASAGQNCANPNIISSLPFSQTNMTTNLYGSNYSSTDACGSNYMNGNDFVFEYTATIAECINISLSNTSSSTGLFILDGCPDAGASCLTQGDGTDPNAIATITPGTYYIVVSTDPSFGGPQSTSFDIDIITNAAGGTGTTCGNPHVITGNFSQTNMTTSCFGNEYNSTMACNSVI